MEYILFNIKNALLATNIFLILSILLSKLQFPTWKKSIKLGLITIIIYFIIYFGLYCLINDISI
ncbi:hypothetical protein D1093_05060 [Bartonella kosoyi]|uniref:Uncharacterized protein n=1 Tax=Bartonella kosoyi TaxID=2133959 RepID=A0A5B9CWY1_9HYPH|nr:hypothetical protein D1093_05060 [Bartonella kosoyi]